MRQKLEDFCTPITAGNIEENIDTFYNGHNTTKKQLKPLWPSSNQSENQALDTTLRSSPKPEMQKKYINIFNLGPNRNPAGKSPVYDQYNSNA